MLVDRECLVAVAGGIRRRPIWWDTVDSMYVDRRPQPRWAIGALSADDAGKPAYVIVVRLKSGEEIPLWAVASINDGGEKSDTPLRTEKLLQRLTALAPPPGIEPADLT